MNYDQFLRDKITRLRLERNISEYQLSLELGKCKTYIQAITSGKSLPSFDAFFDLCSFFGITPADFFAPDTRQSTAFRHTADKLARLSPADLALVDELIDRLTSRTGGNCNETRR